MGALRATARGVAHRVRERARSAAREMVREVRVPAERALRAWVRDEWPGLAARRYDGAQGGRRGGGWIAGSTSANAEIARDLVRLRNRARDLVRNDPIANRIIDALVLHVIGTGIVPKSATGDMRTDAMVDDLFDRWQRKAAADGVLSFYAQQALVARTLFESGEVLAQAVPRRSRLVRAEGLPVPLQISVLEPDHLDHTLTGSSSLGVSVSGGGYLHQGVEFDSDDRRVAYWLWRQHPGEQVGAGTLSERFERVRVPARECAHVYRPLRAGQVRGVTLLAPVMWTLRQVGLYLDAELERKGTEALVTAIARSSNPARRGIGDPQTVVTDGVAQSIATLEPAAVLSLDDTESVEFSHPVPTDPASALKGLLRRVAAGVGLPYEMLSADLEGVNYSSIRYGMLPFRVGVWTWQEHTLIPLYCQRVWDWWVESAVASGALPDRAGGYPVKWATPRWEEVDRLKEALADIAEIRAGLRSYADVLASRGESWREVMAEAEQFIAAMTAAGLSFDSDPRRPQSAAAATVTDPAADPAPADRPPVRPGA